nr:hypothetical protein [Candidatus Sigynarchaeota archaeon]
MKIFRLSNGQIVQIIDKEKVQKWNPEMPVIFVNYLLDKKIDSYGTPKDQSEIRAYLNDILETVAVPKLTNALKSGKKETRLAIANNLVEITKKKPDIVKSVLSFLQESEKNESDQAVKTAIAAVIKNYDKSQKRKQYEVNRKKMKEFDAKMDDLDQKLVAGKITADEYTKARKQYVKEKGELDKMRGEFGTDED